MTDDAQSQSAYSSLGFDELLATLVERDADLAEARAKAARYRDKLRWAESEIARLKRQEHDD